MTVTLSQTRVRPDDNQYDIIMVGVNYPNGRVTVRVQFQSGDTRDITFEDARLTALRNSVSQFSGLRLALEQYLAANETGFGGNAT